MKNVFVCKTCGKIAAADPQEAQFCPNDGEELINTEIPVKTWNTLPNEERAEAVSNAIHSVESDEENPVEEPPTTPEEEEEEVVFRVRPKTSIEPSKAPETPEVQTPASLTHSLITTATVVFVVGIVLGVLGGIVPLLGILLANSGIDLLSSTEYQLLDSLLGANLTDFLAKLFLILKYFGLAAISVFGGWILSLILRALAQIQPQK